MESTQHSAWNIIHNAYIFAVLITLRFLRVDGKEMFIFFLYATLSRKDIVM